MRFDMISIFPEMFNDFLTHGIVRRALESNLFEFHAHDLRDFGKGNYKQVDDKPFGGGAGLVMQAPQLMKCYENIPKMDLSTFIYLSPRGKTFSQETARELAESNDQLIFLAGRYEGVDQRFLEKSGAREISLGDFILSGGELGAMVVMDAVVRLIPGALGNADSTEYESFSMPLLEHDQYTMPREWEGIEVPEVLTTGNHAKIERWRVLNSLKRTAERRPDLLEKLPEGFFNKLV